jgi:hypothetical protein
MLIILDIAEIEGSEQLLQTNDAPPAAASRTLSIAFCRLAALSAEQLICTRPTFTLPISNK